MPILLVTLSTFLFTLNGQIGAILSGVPISLYIYADFRSIILSEKNFSGNFFLQILNPLLFVSIVCAYFENILSADACALFWLIVPIYWSMHLLFIFIKNYRLLLNLWYVAISCILSNLLSYTFFKFFLQPLIYSPDTIFTSQTALRDALWYGLIAYIFAFSCKIYLNYMAADKLAPKNKWQKFILERKRILFAQYDKLIQILIDKEYPKLLLNKDSISSGREEFIALLYAIMIYEDFNRPKYLRYIENILVRLPLPFHQEYSLGIMQIKSNKPLTDEESIACAITHFLPIYLNTLQINGHPLFPQKNTTTDFSQTSSSQVLFPRYTETISKEFSGFHFFRSRNIIPSPHRIFPHKKPQNILNINVAITYQPISNLRKARSSSQSQIINSAIRKVLDAYNGPLYKDTVYYIYREITKTDIP